jgi:hypothetical protein
LRKALKRRTAEIELLHLIEGARAEVRKRGVLQVQHPKRFVGHGEGRKLVIVREVEQLETAELVIGVE